MKKVAYLVCLTILFIHAHNALAESLEFSKAAIDGYKEGSTSVKATMIMPDGTKHQSPVQLQQTTLLKSIKSGNLVFVKKHNEVFEVIRTSTSAEGVTTAEIKSTYLTIGPKKFKGRKKSYH